jgi:hypothetical protein
LGIVLSVGTGGRRWRSGGATGESGADSSSQAAKRASMEGF